MKSLAEISIIMPSVASSTSTGNSKPPILCAAHEIDRQQQRDRASPTSASAFMKRANASSVKAP